ncbi:hypothetical protein QYF36_004350 [Acer negundo]|nr:hypothetical protein QYF36_004350 [Acer negundo]
MENEEKKEVKNHLSMHPKKVSSPLCCKGKGGCSRGGKDMTRWIQPLNLLLLSWGRRFLFPQINEKVRSQLILPKNWKRNAMPRRGDGKINSFEERNWGSQCFSTPNEICQPRNALLLTPQGSETELNLGLG